MPERISFTVGVAASVKGETKQDEWTVDAGDAEQAKQIAKGLSEGKYGQGTSCYVYSCTRNT